MKRSLALQSLSRDHHTALVLAKACVRAAEFGDEEEIASMCAKVELAFEQELTPHFNFEEENLLPRLQVAGELVPVERTLKEHGDLRAMAQNIGHHGSAAALSAFGQLLADHVRFEERELFPCYERLADEQGEMGS